VTTVPCYDRYGVPRNPFDSGEVKPYRPPKALQPNAVDPFIVSLDGLGAASDAIDAALDHAVQGNASAFFLVVGKSGAGLSSAAWWILEQYRIKRQIDASRFFIPEPTIDHDAVGAFREWLGRLFEAVAATVDVHEDVEKRVVQQSEGALDHPLGLAFRRALGSLATVMSAAPPPLGYGVCFENIPTYAYVKEAVDTFGGAQTVCVFTCWDTDQRRQDVIRPVRENNASPVRIVELGEVFGPEVVTLIEHYWRRASQERSPFAHGALENTVGKRQWTIRRALGFMTKMLATRATFLRPGSVWPDDPNLELELSQSQIEDILREWEGR
jgi:hypothetical protein